MYERGREEIVIALSPWIMQHESKEGEPGRRGREDERGEGGVVEEEGLALREKEAWGMQPRGRAGKKFPIRGCRMPREWIKFRL